MEERLSSQFEKRIDHITVLMGRLETRIKTADESYQRKFDQVDSVVAEKIDSLEKRQR